MRSKSDNKAVTLTIVPAYETKFEALQALTSFWLACSNCAFDM